MIVITLFNCGDGESDQGALGVKRRLDCVQLVGAFFASAHSATGGSALRHLLTVNRDASNRSIDM